MTQDKILRYAFEEVSRQMFEALAKATKSRDVIDEYRYNRLKGEFQELSEMIMVNVSDCRIAKMGG